MSLLVSILLVLSTWLLFQQWFIWQRKRRRTIPIAPEQGTVREVVDGVELVVTPSQSYFGFLANQPTHTIGRLVLTEQWLVLACDKGLLLKVDRGQPFSVKRLGPHRLILIGSAVNPAVHLRVIMTVDKDAEWIEPLLQFSA